MTRWRHLVIVVALAGSAAAVPGLPARSATAVVRQEIAALYPAAAVERIDRPAGEVRQLVRDRIAARLPDDAVAIRGTDFRIAAPEGGSRHLGVIRLRFATAATAGARACPLSGDGRFLHGTKVLTPMAVAVRGAEVIVLFTESAGDPALRALLPRAARLLGQMPVHHRKC